ncbi:MAG: LacI family DNA-binding transcriptional regulator [Anaerolineales bacterium]|nr:LacI family DNA-binding transcriptional regulator [Anaerolineales bacterium]
MNDLTLDDIAKLAGVSKATVSRVINDYPNVRESTRRRVQQVIDETGFRPNFIAQSLVSKNTRLLGLVIPRNVHGFFSDPYFPRLIEGISQACNHYGYALTLSLFHSDQDERDLFPKITQKGFLDGIIVQATGLPEEFSPRIEHWAVPYVFVGRPLTRAEVSYVDVDNFKGAQRAIAHLAQLGRRRIATVTGALNTTPGQDRLKGHRQALNDHGLLYADDLVEEADFTEASAYCATKKLLARQPDAIFVASDAMAIGVLRAIREAGLVVPNDIALVGFDDLPPATMATPQLTTIHQPIARFGYKAVETLVDIIDNGPTPLRRFIYETELVVRESCGACLQAPVSAITRLQTSDCGQA